VLLLGQYSTGKTTFLRHLVGGDFPGMHIGPEPTTDKFIALVHGEEKEENNKREETAKENDNTKSTVTELVGGKTMKGNTLTVTPELPFASLSQFGSSFLNHFEGSISSSSLLKHITLIDTPGVLSGETTQRLSRDYNFASAAKWFADRADLILLLFDAHKIDVSDEMKRVIDCIRRHNDDKIRCVLNKADGVSSEELVRVYGSLMWSMGRTFCTPEVIRVYTGSYWEKPYQTADFAHMFEKDERLLVEELLALPKSAAERKVNRMVKRIRLVKAQCCLLGHLRQKMSSPWWLRWWNVDKSTTREKVLSEMDSIMDEVCTKYHLSRGDMPNSMEFSSRLASSFPDLSVFPIPSQKLLKTLDDLIVKDIPKLMKGAGGITGTTVLENLSSPVKQPKDSGEHLKRAMEKLKIFSGTVNKARVDVDQDRQLSSLEDKENQKNSRVRKYTILIMFTAFVMIFIGLMFFENEWTSKLNYGGYAWLCSLVPSWV